MTSSAEHPVYFSQLTTPVGHLLVKANPQAITHVSFIDNAARIGPQQESHLTQHAAKQLDEYIKGKRKDFDLPLAANGTVFQQQVWQQLLSVPFGKTASYLDIANAINNPKACRAVGAANGKNPIAIIVPCHRIIGANGSLTGYAGGLTRKTFLLELEQAY
ncbi:MAG: methylated-DNA--[protein]-cysteine S-methyltransferase [Glaciecola sp.]